MDARTDLRLVEIRERTAAAGHRLRDNLCLHLSDRTEGRGLVALSDASPQPPSPASRQSLARHHQGSASIHDRPKTIENRGEAGHWEGDLIICKCTRPVLVLHERKSRVTLAARLTGKTAAETISAMLAVFGRIDPHLRRSITFDNDTAFAQHALLRTMRDMTTWFCDAYASWQKGGIENANGRLRRWLPRHLDIDRIYPTRTSRRSSSRPTSPPANASGSRRHSTLLAEL